MSADVRPALITGGAGFIGTNLAARLAAEGRRVIILDDLSRPGVERNLEWLLEHHGERIEHERADVLDARAVRRAVDRAGEVYHLAAQVAVTTSLDAPVRDFEVNARGTLNVLEAIRAQAAPPPVIFTSTNKVYGALGDIPLVKEGGRYVPEDARVRAQGIDETRALDFHSPYGCSKGAADQYVLDYARCYGIASVVFRMSCIYGPHQCGNEDQGWVAHFLLSARERRPLTLYGDGCQVRDVLYVDDLVEAFRRAMAHIDRLRGRAFNIGGGPANAVSLNELTESLSRQHGYALRIEHSGWRNGDQRYYVSNTARFRAATGWSPQVSATRGLALLNEWFVSAEHATQPADALPRAHGPHEPLARAAVQ
jgi:CDP-paratose 2-epimerase